MANNYKTAEPVFMISSIVLVILFVYGIVVVNLKAFDKMNELENL
jgi:hypothetical protein